VVQLSSFAYSGEHLSLAACDRSQRHLARLVDVSRPGSFARKIAVTCSRLADIGWWRRDVGIDAYSRYQEPLTLALRKLAKTGAIS
jgi:hypothetical protein